MPKCDTCGFSHAQPNHCINCGNPDPFRRHRVVKLTIGIVLALVAIALAGHFYTRYSAIERSVRQAQLAAESEQGFSAPQPAQPQ